MFVSNFLSYSVKLWNIILVRLSSLISKIQFNWLFLLVIGILSCIFFGCKTPNFSTSNQPPLKQNLPFSGLRGYTIPSLSYSDTVAVIDTLVYHQVGPGIVYGQFKMPKYPLNIYLLTIDLNNPYNFIETFQAQDQVGKTELMTRAYQRLRNKDWEPVGGINGSFWIVNGQGQPKELLGVAHSGSIRNGEMMTDPNGWNRGRTTDPLALLQEIGVAVIDKEKKVWIDDMGFDGTVTTSKNDSYKISSINRMRNADELVAYNHYMGDLPTRTDDEGTEVVVRPILGAAWAVNEIVSCEVIKVFKNKGANSISAHETLLSGSGKAKIFLDHLTVGEIIKVNMGVHRRADGKRPQVVQMITGNALVMKDGELTIRNTNEGYNAKPYPRTGVGMSKDGKKLFLVVIDRSMGSIGATTATMSNFLKLSGAWNVSSMDGGGSAQLMLGGKIMNKPADGKERAVANGWFVYHKATANSHIKYIDFATYKIETADYPRILGYNKYGVLINEDVRGVHFKRKAGFWKIDKAGKRVFQKPILIARYKWITVQKEINTTLLGDKN